MTGPAAPDTAALATFWAAAKQADPSIRADGYRIRAIGNTPDSMKLILTNVLIGEKRGTFSLPWLHAKNPGQAPKIGEYVILVDYDGKPAALLTTTAIEEVTYATITGAHTAIDGPSVRPLDKWKAVHEPHFTNQLAAAGLTFSPDMPVLVEHFKLVYPKTDPNAVRVRGLDALPQGPARPTEAALEAFWRAVKIARADLDLPNTVEVRWIGIDAPSTEQIFQYILDGTKVGTFRLPEQIKARGHIAAKVGDPIVLIAWDGTPRLAIRITSIEQTTFAAIDQRYTSLDGPPVKDVDVWKPLHRKFWSADLPRDGLAFREDMPVVVERFELIYPKP